MSLSEAYTSISSSIAVILCHTRRKRRTQSNERYKGRFGGYNFEQIILDTILIYCYIDLWWRPALRNFLKINKFCLLTFL